jgi:hypothetical protein
MIQKGHKKMSIHLSIHAEDAEVEHVLAFVRSQFPNLYTTDQASILERAVRWLRAADDGAFNTDPHRPNSVEFRVDAIAPVCVQPSFEPEEPHGRP